MDTTTQKQIQSGVDCCLLTTKESSDVINDPIFSIFVSQDGQSIRVMMRGEDGLGAPPCCVLHHVNTSLS